MSKKHNLTPTPTPTLTPTLQKMKIKVRKQVLDSLSQPMSETLQADQTNANLDLWVEKYRPRTLKDLIGNEAQVREICEWFRKFKQRDTSIKKALLFSGCPGTSKTTVAHAVLREFGYDIKEYNASDVRSRKLVEENLDKLISMEQVDKHFRSNFKPFGIIMDEVDGMSSGDKGGMTQLIRTINPNRGKRCVKKSDKQKIADRWIPPIICICNIQYDKKINELKKDCLEIKFNKPTIAELLRVITKIIQAEHIEMTNDAKQLIAELSQGDYRRLMILLQNFSNIQTHPITKDHIYNYYDVIAKKTLDLNSFDITNKIFQRHTSIDEILRFYDSDKSLLPMMVHENYLNFVMAENTTLEHKLVNCYHCINSIVRGDLIEKMMYNTQNWSMQTIHGLTSCYIPSYYTNQYPRLSNHSIKWTTTLGRFSLQRANIKNINFLASIVNTGLTYSVDDMQLLSQVILFHLLDPNGQKEIGMEYLKNYNLTIKDIEKLIKIDKINDTYKKMYVSSQKTHLLKMTRQMSQKKIPTMFYYIGRKNVKYNKSSVRDGRELIGKNKSISTAKKEEDSFDSETEQNSDSDTDHSENDSDCPSDSEDVNMC
ncbi:MAG: AAA family ATPase [candidate division WOR-3 bacterium]